MVEVFGKISEKIANKLKEEKVLVSHNYLSNSHPEKKNENSSIDEKSESDEESLLSVKKNAKNEKNAKIFSIHSLTIVYSLFYILVTIFSIILIRYEKTIKGNTFDYYTIFLDCPLFYQISGFSIFFLGILIVYFLNKISNSYIMSISGYSSHSFLLLFQILCTYEYKETDTIIMGVNLNMSTIRKYCLELVFYFTLFFNFVFLFKSKISHMYITSIKIIIFIYFLGFFVFVNLSTLDNTYFFLLFILNGVSYFFSYFDLKQENFDLFISNWNTNKNNALYLENSNYYCLENEL